MPSGLLSSRTPKAALAKSEMSFYKVLLLVGILTPNSNKSQMLKRLLENKKNKYLSKISYYI